MNMCLLQVAMCEKYRSSHFQSDGESKKFEDWGGGKIFQDWEELPIWGGCTFAGGRSVPHYMPWKCVLRNFAKFLGKQLCQSLFFNKVAEIFKNTFFTEHIPATASAQSFIKTDVFLG